MKKLIISSVVLMLSFTLNAQENPFKSIIADTRELLNNNDIETAISFWNESSRKFKTDSLYVYAASYIGESLTQRGYYKYADIIFNEAEEHLLHMQSDTEWWWVNYSNLEIKRAYHSMSLHDYVRASSQAFESKVSLEHVLNKGMDYAASLIILAEASYFNKQFVPARIFAGEALLTAVRVYSQEQNRENFYDLSYILRETSMIEFLLGYVKEAIGSLETLKDLNEKNGVKDANLDEYLGILYAENKEYDKAIEYLTPYYEESQDKAAKLKSGIYLLLCMRKLGQQNLYPLALNLSLLQKKHVSNIFSYLSSEERSLWWMSLENRYLDLLNSILLDSDEPVASELIADNNIISKGLLLRTSSQIRNLVLKSENDALIIKLNRIMFLYKELSEKTDNETDQSIKEEIKHLEKDILEQISLPVIPDWKTIAKNLTNKEVAIDFMCIEDVYDSTKREYYAILIDKSSKHPFIIDLFEEKEIKHLIERADKSTTEEYINSLYCNTTNKKEGKNLYDIVWGKISERIKGKSTIYYCPVGILNSISFQALSSGDGFIGEKYSVHQVSSLSNISKVKNEKKQHVNNSYIFGGIKYDVDDKKMLEESLKYKQTKKQEWKTFIGEEREGFGFLPGTVQESNDIYKIMKDSGVDVNIINGEKANEESFKHLDGKNINTIHIATHGFYLDNKNQNKRRIIDPVMLEKNGVLDPMLRSGLLFAGSNLVWKGERPPKDIDDGILTAKEISQMNLSDTKLVVLSACQTGLGEVKSTEGVYGLQRAFKLAGVETIIMSLWKVDDKATSILMKYFYESYLHGETKQVAFRSAINKVKNLKDERGEKIYSSPYFWGGFVMLD